MRLERRLVRHRRSLTAAQVHALGRARRLNVAHARSETSPDQLARNVSSDLGCSPPPSRPHFHARRRCGRLVHAPLPRLGASALMIDRGVRVMAWRSVQSCSPLTDQREKGFGSSTRGGGETITVSALEDWLIQLGCKKLDCPTKSPCIWRAPNGWAFSAPNPASMYLVPSSFRDNLQAILVRIAQLPTK
jgi:hypothetical protein